MFPTMTSPPWVAVQPPGYPPPATAQPKPQPLLQPNVSAFTPACLPDAPAVSHAPPPPHPPASNPWAAKPTVAAAPLREVMSQEPVSKPEPHRELPAPRDSAPQRDDARHEESGRWF
jgi:hypothetical protein